MRLRGFDMRQESEQFGNRHPAAQVQDLEGEQQHSGRFKKQTIKKKRHV